MAITIGESTGLAVQPLLAAGLLGAYEYFSVVPAQRNKLLWHSSPYFWGTTLAIGILFMCNGLIGSWVPALGKPMAAIETIEHPVTATFVAAPIIASKIGGILQTVITQQLLSSFFQKQDVVMAGVSFEMSTVLYIIAGILVVSAFFVVWLFSQTLNALIFLSPAPPLDWVLNVFKYGILSLILVSFLINPYFGLAVSLAIIIFCWLISAWCFRFTVFGTVFAWDFITLKHKRYIIGNHKIKVFTSCKIAGVPKRTYGSLDINNNENLVFTYRQWLIFHRCSVTLNSSSDYSIEKGLFYPSIAHDIEDKNKYIQFFTLPPRYKNHEQQVGKTLKIVNMIESKPLRGFKVAFQWLKNIFRKDAEVFTLQ